MGRGISAERALLLPGSMVTAFPSRRGRERNEEKTLHKRTKPFEHFGELSMDASKGGKLRSKVMQGIELPESLSGKKKLEKKQKLIKCFNLNFEKK
jgi:hypothetical protein